MTKKCPSCGEEKLFSEFHKNKNLRFGLACNCKKCSKIRASNFYAENRETVLAQNAAWQKANPEKSGARSRRWVLRNPKKRAAIDRAHYIRTKEHHENCRLKRVYGISLEEKLQMFESQNGKCAICERALLEAYKSHVDHNHITGKVRELLCQDCNHGLGNFDENPAVLRRAVAYLHKHSEVKEPSA